MGWMFGKIPRLAWLSLPLAYFLFFYRLAATGLLGPDEPRYASVAREMAASGDWVTPRLWGQPWFEKPALEYWMTAAGFRLGLGPELAPRLPVALLALAFLGFYWWVLRREFGCTAAWLSTLILGTSIGWIAFSQIGVPDLPLTVTFSAAMLLALPWVSHTDTRPLPAASALLGLAVLAKGLVPVVLALPLLGFAAIRGRIRDFIRPTVVAPFLVVALPWYVFCWMRNGRVFLDVFFGQHQFGRFTSTALLHGQAWWFYVPVLLAGLLPWTPLVLLVAQRGVWHDLRRVYLAVWVVFGLVFFSAAANKLPGYILPLVPAAAALMGLGLAEARNARPWLAASALLLAVYPVAAQVLPLAVADGLSHAARPAFDRSWLLPVVFAAVVSIGIPNRKRLAAAAALAAASTVGVIYLKTAALPAVDRIASARPLWREIGVRAAAVCVDTIHRDLRYGLNFYSVRPLPDCVREPKPLVVRQMPGQPPFLDGS